jgi:hypothetical protein
MSRLLETIIKGLERKGLWDAALHSAVSSLQQEVELFRNSTQLINKSHHNYIDPAALGREGLLSPFVQKTGPDIAKHESK